MPHEPFNRIALRADAAEGGLMPGSLSQRLRVLETAMAEQRQRDAEFFAARHVELAAMAGMNAALRAPINPVRED